MPINPHKYDKLIVSVRVQEELEYDGLSDVQIKYFSSHPSALREYRESLYDLKRMEH